MGKSIFITRGRGTVSREESLDNKNFPTLYESLGERKELKKRGKETVCRGLYRLLYSHSLGERASF